MTEDRRLALQRMAGQQVTDATFALVAVQELKELLQGIQQRAKDMAYALRDDGEPHDHA